MKKKLIGLIGTVAIMGGIIGGVAYAHGYDNNDITRDRMTVNEISARDFEWDSFNDDHYDDMIDIMKENGFKALADNMENGNYEYMDEFMNNITEEDYNKMIDAMKENGYGYMAEMMESIGREEMIEMHNSMHGGDFDVNDHCR